MDHFPWIVGNIESISAADVAHARSGVRDLVAALLSLQGRGSTAMVFGMSSGSLVITDEERGKAIDLVRAALLAKRDAFARAGDTELLLELSEIADTCALPQLRFQRPPISRTHHPDAPWLRDVLAGIVVLRDSTDQTVEAVLNWFQQNYRGPDFGGLDIVRPTSGNGDFSLLVGRWTDCIHDDVQEAVDAFLKALEQSVRAVDAGMTISHAGQQTTFGVRSPTPTQLEVVPWHAYHGVLSLRSGPLDPMRIQRLVRDVFPSVPQWTGMHMGAPHWLGHGVNASDGHIHHVAPYVRVDFPADGNVELAAMAPELDFSSWLRSFLEALSEVEPHREKPDAGQNPARGPAGAPRPWWKLWN